VPSWANSFVVIGVRIHALLADEAKVNLLSGAEGRDCATSAQPQKAQGQQIDDFLVRVPGAAGGRNGGGGFGLVHGKRFDEKRSSC
jgi:hypothetical protein